MKRIWMGAILALGTAYAATLPYQGLATDAKNNPKVDGSYSVGFALYSASSGGSALWSESQSVATKKGLFSATLGSISIIPDNLFQGSPLYLGVSFDGGSEGGRVLRYDCEGNGGREGLDVCVCGQRREGCGLER